MVTLFTELRENLLGPERTVGRTVSRSEPVLAAFSGWGSGATLPLPEARGADFRMFQKHATRNSRKGTIMVHSLRSGRGLALALGLIIVLAGANVPAQTASNNGSALTLDSIAPPGLFAFVTVAGIEDASAAADQLGLFRLWKEPEVQRFLGPLVAMYRKTAEGIPAEPVQHWASWKKMFSGRISAAVGGLTVVWAREGRQLVPVPMPGMVMSIDLGDQKQAFRQVVDGWLKSDNFNRTLRGWSRSHETYRGQDIIVLKTTQRYMPGLCVTATYLENLFLVGLNRTLLHKCIDLHQDGGPVFRDAPAFKRARSKAEAGPLVEVFVNVQEITGRIRGLVPDEWLEVLHDTGLDSINAFYYASAVHDGDSFDTCYLDAPGPRRGLLAAMSGTVDSASLKRVPRDAIFAKVARFDFGQVHDALWHGLKKVLPEREMETVARGIARWEKKAGLSIRNDILAALGEEWIAYVGLSGSDIVPELVVAVDVGEPEAMQRVIRTALAHARVATHDVKFGDITVTMLVLPGDVTLRPAFAIVGKRLWFSLTPAGLKAVVLQENGPEESLLDSPNFRDTFRGMPLEKAVGLRYLDLKRLAGYGYNLAEHFLPGLVQNDDFPVDFALLPSQDVVLRHLNSCGGVVLYDEDGLLFKQRSIGLATLYALAARFVDRAPGVPHIVLERMGGWFRSHVRDAGRSGSRGVRSYRPSEERVVAPARIPTAEAESSARAVNPLKPGDAREAKLQKTLAELTRSLARKPRDPALHFQRGQVLHLLRKFDLAATDFQLAFQGKANPPVSAYNAACCLSLAGQKEQALHWLEVAFQNRFQNWPLIKVDGDLANLRSDPRFKALVARFRRL